MNVSCPSCATIYRVDPRKIPSSGVRARCAQCREVFAVTAEAEARPAPAPAMAPQPEPIQPESPAAAASAPESSPFTAAPAPAAPVFGANDPHGKARRLARALISDMVVYHPERRERSLAAGRLRQEFREEIEKSWEEYVAQVGTAFARETPYFRDALNEILAGGARVF